MIIGGNRGPLMLVPVLLLLLFQGCTATKAPKKVLIIPREGSADLKMALTKEYMVMANGLREAGYSIEVATLSGRELKASTIGLTPDKKLSDVRTKDYAGIMMPCMNAGLGFRPPEEAIRIAKEAVAANIPIAAQQGSVAILTYAKVWDPDDAKIPNDDPEREYGGTGVFQKGYILTSGICPYHSELLNLPDGTPELTRQFISMLNSKTRK